MQALVSIIMAEGDTPLEFSPEEISSRLLDALGGDAEKDHVQVNISMPSNMGSVGTPPSTLPPGSAPP